MMPQVSALDVNIAGLNRRLSDVIDTVRNLIAHHSEGLNRFIENFERELANGTVNVDDYCNNAKDLMRDEIQNLNNLAQVEGKGQVLKSTLLTLMEVLRRYGLLKPEKVEELEAVGDPDTLFDRERMDLLSKLVGVNLMIEVMGRYDYLWVDEPPPEDNLELGIA